MPSLDGKRGKVTWQTDGLIGMKEINSDCTIQHDYKLLSFCMPHLESRNSNIDLKSSLKFNNYLYREHLEDFLKQFLKLNLYVKYCAFYYRPKYHESIYSFSLLPWVCIFFF